MRRPPSIVGKQKTSCTGAKSLILKFLTAVISLRYARVPWPLQGVAGAGSPAIPARAPRPVTEEPGAPQSPIGR